MAVVEVAGEQRPEGALVQDENVGQAYPREAPDRAVRIRMLPGTPRGGDPLLAAQAGDVPLHPLARPGSAVPQGRLGRGVPGTGLDEFSRRSLARRMLRDGGMDAPPSCVRCQASRVAGCTKTRTAR